MRRPDGRALAVAFLILMAMIADRALEHLTAHKAGGSVEYVTLRAEDVVALATRGGAKALGKDDQIGSLERGKLADIVLVKNEHSPTFAPILSPYGHLVYQAERGDVHTVLVGGDIIKYDGRLTAGDLAGVKAGYQSTKSLAPRAPTRTPPAADLRTGRANARGPPQVILGSLNEQVRVASAISAVTSLPVRDHFHALQLSL